MIKIEELENLANSKREENFKFRVFDEIICLKENGNLCEGLVFDLLNWKIEV